MGHSRCLPRAHGWRVSLAEGEPRDVVTEQAVVPRLVEGRRTGQWQGKGPVGRGSMKMLLERPLRGR